MTGYYDFDMWYLVNKRGDYTVFNIPPNELFVMNEDKYIKNLDPVTKVMVEDFVNQMVERSVYALNTGAEIFVPMAWIVPDFAERVIEKCKRDGTKIDIVHGLDNTLIVTLCPRRQKKQTVLVICGEDESNKQEILNGLDNNLYYKIVSEFSVAPRTISDIENGLKTGRNVAMTVRADDEDSILEVKRNIKDVVARYNADIIVVTNALTGRTP